MTKPSTEELDLAMYMTALVATVAKDAEEEHATDEQRARLKTWYAAYDTSPEYLKLSMKQITEKDLVEHILCKLGV